MWPWENKVTNFIVMAVLLLVMHFALMEAPQDPVGLPIAGTMTCGDGEVIAFAAWEHNKEKKEFTIVDEHGISYIIPEDNCHMIVAHYK